MVAEVHSIPRELHRECSQMLDWKAQPCNPAEPPQLIVLYLFQPSLVPAGLAELYLEAREKGKGKELLWLPKQDSNQKDPNQKATHTAKFVTHCSQAIHWP